MKPGRERGSLWSELIHKQIEEGLQGPAWIWLLVGKFVFLLFTLCDAIKSNKSICIVEPRRIRAVKAANQWIK